MAGASEAMKKELQPHLNSLPKELKDMVFAEACDAVDRCIEISLAADGVTLISPALDVLATLKKTNSKLFEMANACLLRPGFRFQLRSEQWPYRFLLRALRQKIPAETRNRISHVVFSRMTFYGLANAVRLSERGKAEVGSDVLDDKTVSHSPYFQSPAFKECREHDERLRLLKTDIRTGIIMLPSILPNCKKLDLSLDIVDCIPMPSRETDLSTAIDLALTPHPNEGYDLEQAWRNNGYLFPQLEQLSKYPDITDMDIRILWDKFLQRDWNFDIEISQEIEMRLQDIFMGFLRDQVHAKSLTSHRAT